MDYDLHALMQNAGGRRFIYRLLKDCGTDNAVLPIDPCAAAYQSGKRSVGIALLQDIRNLPDGLELELAMRKEARAQPEKSPDDFYKQFR